MPTPPRTYAISIKGVAVDSRDRVLLLKNERDEWELPGGRIEIGESPEECVAREVTEETQWKVTAGPILDTWMYYIDAVERHVFIVSYGCHPQSDADLVLSTEHQDIGLFSAAEVAQLRMPGGYRRSISTWLAHPTRNHRVEPG